MPFQRRLRPAQTSPAEVAARRGDVHLVDVRGPAEWRTGHIAGAQHIPLEQLPRRLHELERDRPIVTVCRSGNRSDVAAQVLASQGHDTANLAGGMQAWAAAGLPITTPEGHAGRVA